MEMIEKLKGDYPEIFNKYGFEMKRLGEGCYPYDCICKDLYPDAMIYINDKGGWMPIIKE